jgi:hypothetical protein
MPPATLAQSSFALNYSAPPPDENGNPFSNVGYVAVPGQDEIIALSLSGADSSGNDGVKLVATGYSVGGQSGAVLFQQTLADLNNGTFPGAINGPSITVLANGTVAIAWQVMIIDHAGDAQDSFIVLTGSGQTLAGGPVAKDFSGADFLNFQGPPDLYATAGGFNMEWNAHSAFLASNPFDPQAFVYQVQPFDLGGNPAVRSTTALPVGGTRAFAPHAFATAPPVSLQLADNAVQVYDGTTLVGGATIPGEPVHAITSEAAAMLTGGDAAVAWVDSGTAYVSLFDPLTDSFGGPIGLVWGGGGVSGVHVVALPDGGFVTSWMNILPPFGSPMGHYPLFEGRVFAADGTGGAVMQLSGDVAGIDSHGDLFTVASSAGSEYIVTYAINGGDGSGGGTTGQTFTSDNNGDHWVGTTGDDTFNLGRGGDIVTGAGGNDTYKFAEIPWAGGHITDFNGGDLLDLTGLMSTTSDTGTDGVADGYLRITNDGSGNAQIWADYHLPGNDGWWLVETVDGVDPTSLQHVGDVFSIRSSTGLTDVSTAAANYTAPASVKTITLTGAQQHIDASATNGVTINSNDSGNVLTGGPGDDAFHLGRGGDWVTGGAGADTFAYPAIPWAGGAITDFNAAQGDRIDVAGLLSQASFTGPDPFAAGYLKFETDSSGDAQLWADYNQPGNDGWWLVATLDGASTSSLHYANGLIT